jgi:hypothetical protein
LTTKASRNLPIFLFPLIFASFVSFAANLLVVLSSKYLEITTRHEEIEASRMHPRATNRFQLCQGNRGNLGLVCSISTNVSIVGIAVVVVASNLSSSKIFANAISAFPFASHIASSYISYVSLHRSMFTSNRSNSVLNSKLHICVGTAMFLMMRRMFEYMENSFRNVRWFMEYTFDDEVAAKEFDSY